MEKQKINLLILNKNLRILDNHALYECFKKNKPFLILYYDHCKPRKPAEISFFWLLKSIQSFEKDLKNLFDLDFKVIYVLLNDSLKKTFSIIQDKFDVQEIFFNFSSSFLLNIFHDEIKLNQCFSNFIVNYEKLNREFKVFTPFYNFCIEEFVKNENSEIFTFFESYDLKKISIHETQKNFLLENQDFWNHFEKINPKNYKKQSSIFGIYNYKNYNEDFPKWWNELEKNWEIGEKAALKKFEKFCEFNVELYSERRDFLDLQDNFFENSNLKQQNLLTGGTSKLSPNIHFGEISVRFIFKKLFTKSLSNKNIQVFLKQIFWREFSYNILYFHQNDLHSKELRVGFFDDFEWKNIEEQNRFEKWKRGQTGFPIIDAAMRQLWLTGWMHNRARMIVASFLVKNLLIDWKFGEQWFFETLVDGDEAINPFSWQWVAGCGTDSAPYFRIFNPILQSQKFDSNGFYIKKFVKELEFVKNDKIHEPWKFFGNLSDFYFEPIVDLQKSRNDALENFQKIKNKKYI